MFVLSHGWMGDVPAARHQYGRWIGAMAACSADVQRMRRKRPGFNPLLIGLHWPSKPWGDDALEAGAASFGAPTEGKADAESDPVEALVEECAGEVAADTPEARAACGRSSPRCWTTPRRQACRRTSGGLRGPRSPGGPWRRRR